jgi:hypothetical protein
METEYLRSLVKVRRRYYIPSCSDVKMQISHKNSSVNDWNQCQEKCGYVGYSHGAHYAFHLSSIWNVHL